MPPLKIAVIGAGISGLSCAWLLSQKHHVTLIEADDRVGGHAHTVDVRVADQEPTAIDTGFIVFNERAYPNFTALLDHLKVARASTNMSFAVSLAGGAYEYCGNGLTGLLGRAHQWFDPRQWRMVWDLVRFYRTGPKRAMEYPLETNLGQFLKSEGYGSHFVDRHILPMAGAIWSATPKDMMHYPVRAFLQFFANHGLLDLGTRPLWQTVVGGSRNYVSALCRNSHFDVVRNQPITSLLRHETSVEVKGRNGFHMVYDHVVLATHAKQALALLSDATAQEQDLLNPFVTRPNLAVLHRDETLMPKSKRQWSAWNYIARNVVQSKSSDVMMVTYWMNALQNLKTAAQYFVTLNPAVKPAAELRHGEYLYHHPVFNRATLAAQEQLWSLQGQRNTWFCGAWFGAGFHEDGLQAGLAVAEQLGGVSRPWTVANPSGRIFVKTIPAAVVEPLVQAAE